MMKRNKLLVLSLLACTLLASCDEEDTLVNGSQNVGNVQITDAPEATLTLQDLYDSLKETSGGNAALSALLERVAELEYVNEAATKTNGMVTLNTKETFKNAPETGFDVRRYHTQASFLEDIEEKFEDIVDGTSYLDDDGKFDAEEYRDYIEETYDYELVKGASKYLTDATNEALVFNYDEYIEEEIIPSLLQSYIYTDYVTSSSKYKGQFSNQYAVRLEVLKIERDTTKVNGGFNSSLIKDVRKVTGKAVTGSTQAISFGTDYSFVTFNSDKEMIIFETTAQALTYKVYAASDVTALYNTLFDANVTSGNVVKTTVAEAKEAVKDKTPVSSWEINNSTVANGEFYEKIEEVLIARKLWNIDREVVLARNYDYKTPLYDAMTETEKEEAKSFASTYSSSNTKPIELVAKQNKITAQQAEYYSEPEYYNKSTYSSVLPSALSSLRGTSARELQTHLVNGRFLLPNQETVADPVYLDTDSNTYYIAEVSDWYGLYKDTNLLDNTSGNTISNYHIEAYQTGKIKEYTDEKDVFKASEEYSYDTNPAKFASAIELVQVSVKNIISDSMKKEAIVSLFTRYNVTVNEQTVYDFILSQYPDYFEEKE